MHFLCELLKSTEAQVLVGNDGGTGPGRKRRRAGPGTPPCMVFIAAAFAFIAFMDFMGFVAFVNFKNVALNLEPTTATHKPKIC